MNKTLWSQGNSRSRVCPLWERMTLVRFWLRISQRSRSKWMLRDSKIIRIPPLKSLKRVWAKRTNNLKCLILRFPGSPRTQRFQNFLSPHRCRNLRCPTTLLILWIRMRRKCFNNKPRTPMIVQNLGLFKS